MWYEVGTHIEFVKGSLENVSDGFFYVSLLSSVQVLLNNEYIFKEVSI